MLMKKELIENNKILLWENRKQKEEIERLNKIIEHYENPEDMTLMYMWCDEKAKEEIERLLNIIDKAIEYVEENLIPENVRQLNGEEFVLLEILKGVIKSE